MRCRALGIATGLLLASACGSSSSSTAPQPQTLNVTGTWVGNLALQGNTTRMTWTLSQTSSVVSGSVLVSQPNGTVLLNGSLSGSLSGLSGSTLTYTIAVSPGGIPSLPACTGQLGGSVVAATGATSTLTGSYALTTATCTTQFSNGNFTLTKE